MSLARLPKSSTGSSYLVSLLDSGMPRSRQSKQREFSCECISWTIGIRRLGATTESSRAYAKGMFSESGNLPSTDDVIVVDLLLAQTTAVFYLGSNLSSPLPRPMASLAHIPPAQPKHRLTTPGSYEGALDKYEVCMRSTFGEHQHRGSTHGTLQVHVHVWTRSSRALAQLEMLVHQPSSMSTTHPPLQGA
ncbi:hypothetical protein BD311DRAFT_742546 [Dichomitus squalens]|uniref:Uncharacterized protein n=1 Tax=Dichomitus squalens TaxID=114155 RepID=A0A4Q9M8D2_9APHY|nr:hypothetical protein BD311DRAFT_742546 [Dichomitus squalens]